MENYNCRIHPIVIPHVIPTQYFIQSQLYQLVQMINILGPNQLTTLVQTTQKLKQKVTSLEKQKLRFQVVMSEVRLGYENKIAQLERTIQQLLTKQVGELIRVSKGEEGESGESGKVGEQKIQGAVRNVSGVEEENKMLQRKVCDLEKNVRVLKQRLCELQSKQLHEHTKQLSGLQLLIQRSESSPAALSQDQILIQKQLLQDQLKAMTTKQQHYEQQLQRQMTKISELEKKSEAVRKQKEEEVEKFKQHINSLEDSYKKELAEVKQALLDHQAERQKETEKLEALVKTKAQSLRKKSMMSVGSNNGVTAERKESVGQQKKEEGRDESAPGIVTTQKKQPQQKQEQSKDPASQ